MSDEKRTAEAILAILDMGRNSEYKLQKFLLKKGKVSIYDIAKGLHWTYGKTQGVVQRLLAKGLVGFEEELKNGRARKLVFLTPSEKLLKPELKIKAAVSQT